MCVFCVCGFVLNSERCVENVNGTCTRIISALFPNRRHVSDKRKNRNVRIRYYPRIFRKKITKSSKISDSGLDFSGCRVELCKKHKTVPRIIEQIINIKDKRNNFAEKYYCPLWSKKKKKKKEKKGKKEKSIIFNVQGKYCNTKRIQ